MKMPHWPDPIGYRNIDFGLKRVYDLLERLDNPHHNLPPTIHIAGTNGKGSTLSFLQAIFADAGLKIHKYTSPHLVNFNERIILASTEISDDFLQKTLNECQKAAEIEPKITPTFFEGITVAAFLAFSRVKADILLLETGMGGRLDATNVVKNPLLSIITPIALDHTEFLGDNLAKIAAEKAGIIKKNNICIAAKQKKIVLEVLEQKCIEQNSQIFAGGVDWNIEKQGEQMVFSSDNEKIDLPLPNLLGEHQIENAGTAIAATLSQNKFKISAENIKNGIKNAIWPARLQQIESGKFYDLLQDLGQKKGFKADLILDGGHNEAGATTIAEFLADFLTEKEQKSRNYLICAMLKDKNSSKFLQILQKNCQKLFAMAIKNEQNSKTTAEMTKIGQELGFLTQKTTDFADALEKISQYHQENFTNHHCHIIICGSLYLAGQFLEENHLKR